MLTARRASQAMVTPLVRGTTQSVGIDKLTRKNIATELGTAREVISRQLKEMESKGYIEINRGNIKINDIAALQDISSS